MKFLEDLASRRRFGVRPGLESISALLSALGSPERALAAVHVAGTNGKGAVAAMLDVSLRAAGFSTARYTSPHLMRLNERFFIDGAPADDEALERVAAKVEAVLKKPPFDALEVTFFEALTAEAFLLFAEKGVDVAVMECGLGGRLDATNVCNPVLTVITRIGLDHCAILGDTLEAIAAEKAGIVKPGVPVILGANPSCVQNVVRAVAASRNAPYFYAPDIVDESEIPADLSLRGSFNRENALTALAALRAASRCGVALRGERRIPGAPPLGALSRVVWPGRFQRVGRFIVDGAHNPPAASALAAALAGELLPGERVNLIAGFCSDKDVRATLRILAPLCRRAIAVKTSNPRSLAAEELAAMMNEAGMSAAAAPSLAAALDSAASLPAPLTLVCGSLFLAGEALALLGAFPWCADRLDPSEQLTTK